MDKPWLRNLNPAQERAVTHPPTSLQILAGPGSGKTRVLTCRVAYLIKELGIEPQNLVVVTFTNKAANEMKLRLNKLLTADEARRLVIGTFHSVAVQYLRRHGSRLDLKPNWVIADRDNSLSYCKALLKDPGVQGAFTGMHVKPPKDSALLEHISKQKSKGIPPEAAAVNAKDDYGKLMAELYASYQDALATDNALDFDDLLLCARRLFGKHPNSIRNIEHVLIDEFQDTNVVQYEITQLLAHSGGVTVVGDPDQSIYLWRSAEVGNIAKMVEDFEGTEQIFLEENYRSSPAILKASLAVVEQDTERIAKSLHTSHPDISPPVLRPFSKPEEEANYIAHEVKRLVAYTGGQLNYNDFAILLRYNALSRALEIALQSAGIPSRMVGGHKFFDRVEIKDVIAYLQLADNPNFAPAFDRVVNTPKRGIGKVGLDAIQADSKKHKIPAFEVCAKALGGSSIGGIKPGQKKALKSLVDTVVKVRQMAQKRKRVADLIDVIVEGVGYQQHLQNAYSGDAETRMLNINELKTHAMRVAGVSEDGEQPVEEESVVDVDDETPTPLRHFLSTSMLSTDADTQDSEEEKKMPKVTISTCHAAKGLEWPVVFVPAVEQGIFPFYRSEGAEQIREERRLLFVAMTRAQTFLYLTHTLSRMQGGLTADATLSQFVANLAPGKQKAGKEVAAPFSQTPPDISAALRVGITSILGRPAVAEDKVKDDVKAHFMTMPPEFPLPGPSASRYGARGGGFGGWGGISDSLFAAHPTYAQYLVGGTGPNRAVPNAGTKPYAYQSSTQRPTAEQLKSGFSTARTVHHQRPTTSSTTLNAPRPGSALAAAMAAKSVKLEMPETRFSQGASPTFSAGGTFETKPAPSPPLPSLDSFQSSSKDFLSGLKSGLPPGEDFPAKSEAAGTSASGVGGNGKKRLGTGRPAPGGVWKKAKAETPARNGL